MNYWKPIVASLVIFISGLVSGVIITNSLVSKPPAEPTTEGGPRPWENRWFIGRLERELDLTSEQRTEIEELLEKSQQDLGNLFGPITEQARQINLKLRDDMRAVMTPEQAKKYDELMSRPPRRGGGPPRGGDFRDRDGDRGDFRVRDFRDNDVDRREVEEANGPATEEAVQENEDVN